MVLRVLYIQKDKFKLNTIVDFHFDMKWSPVGSDSNYPPGSSEIDWNLIKSEGTNLTRIVMKWITPIAQ